MGDDMKTRRLLVLISFLASTTTVLAESNIPGYTDYGSASPDAIESSDLVEALSPSRG